MQLTNITPSQVQQALASAIQRLHGAHILLVEDNPLNCELARLLLERADVTTVVAHDGAAAVEAFNRGSFDCVLMDLQMPGMNGIEATRRIRANHLHMQPPIIALTATIYEREQTECITAGMNDILLKPLDADRFYRTLARWIDPSGERRPRFTCEDLLQEPPEMVSLHLLAQLVDDDEDMMRQLFAIFLDNASATIDAMQDAAARDQTRTLLHLSHRLKSSSRAVGALGLAELCARLETQGRDPEAASRLLGELRPTLQHTRLQANLGTRA